MWRAAQAEKSERLTEFLDKRFRDPLQGIGELEHEGFVFGQAGEDDDAEAAVD